MITRAITAALLLMTAPVAVEAGVWDGVKATLGLQSQPKAPTIKVLLARDLPEATLEVHGKYNIYDPYTGGRLATRFVGKGARLTPMSDGLRWGEAFPAIYQIVVVPDEPHTVSVVNGVEYRGSIFVYQVEGRISIINEVPVEEYVASVLSTTLSEPVEREPMAAMAIAMRTEAVNTALTHANKFWHVEADRVGYLGSSVVMSEGTVPRVMRETRHLVLSKTRAFQGGVTPFDTECVLPQKSMEPAWSLAKAQEMGDKGKNAAQILEGIYPNTSVELMSTMPSDGRDVAGIRPAPSRRRTM